jgi:hypothetical protein
MSVNIINSVSHTAPEMFASLPGRGPVYTHWYIGCTRGGEGGGRFCAERADGFLVYSSSVVVVRL